MPGPAVDVVRRFGAVEDDQRYGRLVELFADDAVYYDPFMGPQRGKQAIREFMGHMEELVPKAGVRFQNWEVEADRVVGWAQWQMVAPGPDGVEVAVPGQSLYRLNDDGLVTFVADYVDSRAYRQLRPDGPRPNLAGAAGLSTSATNPAGPALEVVKRFWQIQDDRRYSELAALFTEDAVFTDMSRGRFHGRAAIAEFMGTMESEMPAIGARFELVDAAGDETVAWSQWTCHLPDKTMAGWTLHIVRGDQFTLDADFFDAGARDASG
jgi:steroid Delta-isomerase